MKKTTLEYRMHQENQRLKVPESKLLAGITSGKHPVIMDDGRTTIFINDERDEEETRQRYALRKDNKVNFYTKKPKI
jgi:hypothetical protein